VNVSFKVGASHLDRVAEGSKGVLNSLVDGHASTTTMS